MQFSAYKELFFLCALIDYLALGNGCILCVFCQFSTADNNERERTKDREKSFCIPDGLTCDDCFISVIFLDQIFVIFSHQIYENTEIFINCLFQIPCSLVYWEMLEWKFYGSIYAGWPLEERVWNSWIYSRAFQLSPLTHVVTDCDDSSNHLAYKLK